MSLLLAVLIPGSLELRWNGTQECLILTMPVMLQFPVERLTDRVNTGGKSTGAVTAEAE